MASASKNENKTDFDLLTYINQNMDYSNEWELKKTKNSSIQSVLNVTSKSGTGERGEPDLIYVNENRKLLILVENKAIVKDHVSKTGGKTKAFAVDGIKHYLSFFTKIGLSNFDQHIQRYLDGWKILGIAFSGDINDQYNNRLDTFIIKDDVITNIREAGILDETDYIAYFENINLEQITSNISKSSKKINNLLRNVDSQNRPILLSALMICLYDEESDFYNNYQSYQPETIITNIPLTIKKVLTKEKVDKDKIDILENELSFLKTDKDLKGESGNAEILKDILKELEERVIPLFDKKTAYDIIGKFYEEFLRYAGVANVKKGIVLTPNHVTTLFSDLIELKTDDVIFDPACGTGAFLIGGMMKLVDTINNSNIPNKKEKIDKIKTDQLLGIEKSTTMFTLAISNMLFRGDGKSQIFNEDFFEEKADNILKNKKPTIGFVNPPFGGKDNKSNPTKKEIQFLEKLLDACSRYVVIIAPLSTYFKDPAIKSRILEKHRLKYVINMPSDLFQPNAGTYTAIAVFETSIPHAQNDKKVVFYNLKDDGLVQSKNKGRTDRKNKWNVIKKDLLDKIGNSTKNEDYVNLVCKSVTGNDEWLINAHSKTDYSNLTKEDFLNNIRQYIIFQTKKDLNLLDLNIDSLTMLEILSKNSSSILNEIKNIDKKPLFDLDIKNWKEHKVADILCVSLGSPIHSSDDLMAEGDTRYVTRSAVNNGIDSFVSYDKNKISDGNAITIGAEGVRAFYQDEEFFTGNKINILRHKSLNAYNALFLCSVINYTITDKFNYGYAIVKQRLEKLVINLPTVEGQPDWQFMENYIKSLPYSNNL